MHIYVPGYTHCFMPVRSNNLLDSLIQTEPHVWCEQSILDFSWEYDCFTQWLMNNKQWFIFENSWH